MWGTSDYLTFAGEYAKDAAVDKGRGQEHINGEILSNSEQSRNMKATHSYKYQHDKVDVSCRFRGGA